jgi:hypothetical protein
VTGDLRAALKVLALASPAGAAVTFTLPREDLLELVGGTENVATIAGPAPAAPDHLLTAADAAKRCALSPRYIYAHADRLPFVMRVGRKVRCSELRLARWLERRPAA